jgi:prolyl 4-hydroxylase
MAGGDHGPLIMAITVNLQREVRDWIAHNLERGVPAQAVTQELMKHGTEEKLASAAVQAVAQSLSEYAASPLRIAAGPRLSAADRLVRVLARVQRPVRS